MIRLLSKVKIIDNSGGLLGRCIKILKPKVQGSPKKAYASVGDLILISVLKTIPGSKIKKGDLFKAVVVRTKKRPNGPLHVSLHKRESILNLSEFSISRLDFYEKNKKNNYFFFPQESGTSFS